MVNVNPSSWPADAACVFSKVKEPWGLLSNMAPCSIKFGSYLIKTSEHLFQALRFSGHPDIQLQILEQKSPMAAKMKTKPWRATHSVENWDQVHIDVMRLCLRLKLHWNWKTFGSELQRSGERIIIEKAPKNNQSGRFWGAIPNPKDRPTNYQGTNMMGQLLMELRDEGNEGRIQQISPPWESISRCAVTAELASKLNLTLMDQPLR